MNYSGMLYLLLAPSVFAGLQIEDLGKTYAPISPSGLSHHLATKKAVCDGNTSLRNNAEEHLKWKGSPNSNGFGYFQRNRDLGQVFNVPGIGTQTVHSIVLRTSKGNSAVLSGTPGAEIYIQLFEVKLIEGERLRINDNQTPKGSRATHGFDMRLHRCDDFVEGIEYIPLQRVSGGIFPETIPPTTHHAFRKDQDGNRLPEQDGHLRFFRIKMTGDDVWKLEGGKRYAFMIGFEDAGKDQGLALAIDSHTHLSAAPEFLKDIKGMPWWGIRREGNGQLPPTMIELSKPPQDKKLLQQLINESLFASNHWNSLAPTTDGYPDVDTYHILQFYLETE